MQKKSIPTEPNGPSYQIQTTRLKSTQLSRGIVELSSLLRSTKQTQAETSETPRANSMWRLSEDLPPTHARVNYGCIQLEATRAVCGTHARAKNKRSKRSKRAVTYRLILLIGITFCSTLYIKVTVRVLTNGNSYFLEQGPLHRKILPQQP